jgi:hypothetical protein
MAQHVLPKLGKLVAQHFGTLQHYRHFSDLIGRADDVRSGLDSVAKLAKWRSINFARID